MLSKIITADFVCSPWLHILLNYELFNLYPQGLGNSTSQVEDDIELN